MQFKGIKNSTILLYINNEDVEMGAMGWVLIIDPFYTKLPTGIFWRHSNKICCKSSMETVINHKSLEKQIKGIKNITIL